MKNIPVTKGLYLINATIALVIGIALLLNPSISACQGIIGPPEEVPPPVQVKPSNGQFVFPAATFAKGEAVRYLYIHSPKQWVQFFVVKSTDGVIRAAFDACDVCYKNKKGYLQRGDFMICMNCGMKFRTDKVNEVTGGCNPAALNRTMKDGNVIITQQDVLSGLRYFQ